MGSSLSRLEAATVDAALDGGRRRPRETPTRESMEAVRLAEAERHAHPTSPPPEGSRVMVARQRWNDDFELETDLVDDLTADLAAPQEPEPFDVSDPYGGLVPVADEEEDPFGGLIPLAEEGANEAPVPSGEIEIDEDDLPSAIDASCLHRVPRLLCTPQEMTKLPMDAKAGFILGYVDGASTVEEILDVCPMSQEEAFALFERLEALGVVAFA